MRARLRRDVRRVESTAATATTTTATTTAPPGAPEAGEWLQQATLAIRAHLPLDVLADTIQPFPTFSEIYVAALKVLGGEVAAASKPVGAEPPMKN
jgi:hypothetical protein